MPDHAETTTPAARIPRKLAGALLALVDKHSSYTVIKVSEARVVGSYDCWVDAEWSARKNKAAAYRYDGTLHANHEGEVEP